MHEQMTTVSINVRYRRLRWQIFAITWLAYAGFYLTRKSFAVAKIAIAKDPHLGWSNARMGWLDGGYLVSYAIGQFVFGIAGDRAGPRRVVLIGMIISVIAGIAMGASSMVLLFGTLYCIQGFAQSSGWGPLTKNVSEFFSRRERGVIMGWWSTNYALGGFIAALIAGYFGDHFGWRWAFYGPSFVLLGVCIVFAIVQLNRPEDAGLPGIEEYQREPTDVVEAGETPSEVPEGSWKVIREVMTNRMVILLCAVYFLLKPARYAIILWGPKYVNERLGTGMAASGLLSGMFELAGPVGALVAGYLSDRVFHTRRVPVCVISLILLGLCLLVFNRLPIGAVTMGAGLFLIGMFLFAADTVVAGTAAVDFGTKRGASTASGIVNGVGSIGAIFGGTLPGFLNSRWGWNGVFGMLGVMAFIAALIMVPRWNALPIAAKK